MTESRLIRRPLLEVRADGRTFAGYAAVFDSDSSPLPFLERIRPGAFARSLASGRDVRLFVNHNSDLLLASSRARTLGLREDRVGLLVASDLPDTTLGRDIATLIRRGDVSGMSFGFTVRKDAWSPDGKRREVLDAELYEVSIVTGWPAYPATTAQIAA